MIFGQKLKILSFFLFIEIGNTKVFCGLLETKLAILDFKNTDLKKSKILRFPQEVSPLVLCQRRKIWTILSFLCFSAK